MLVAGGVDAHETAVAAKRLGALTPLFSKSDPPGALTVPSTWPAVVQLSATFGEAFKPGPALAGWVQAQITARTQALEVSYTPPTGLEPYPWQLEAQALIAATGRALITDEPGTGKTASTILGLVEWVNRRNLGEFLEPVLVICPAAVVDAWVEAWQNWAPHIRAVAWMGPKRRDLAGTADVYVTSYETARNDSPVAGTKAMKPLPELKAAAVVIDECHYIRNAGSGRTKAVLRLAKIATKQDGAVIGLSGTPITRNTTNIYPILQAMEPDAYPSGERWQSRYVESIQGDYDTEVIGLNRYTEPEFRLCLLGQHRRVSKADALPFLPKKVYSIRTVEIPEEWRKVYDDFEANMFAELPDGQELSEMQALSIHGRLTRLASAPCDVEVVFGPEIDEDTGEPKKHTHLHLKAPSWKVEPLLEILGERPGAQTVVFAPSKQLIQLAGDAAAAKGYRVGYIIGGQGRAKRTETVKAFQAGELDVVCVTTSAGGVGLTLTAASTVVFLQRPWFLDESIQSEDRCHRLGSEIHDAIEVIDIVAKNTIESRIRANLRGKAGQLAEFVQDPRIVAELLGGSSVARTKEMAS